MTNSRVDICFHSCSPPIECITRHSVLAFGSCVNNAILDSRLRPRCAPRGHRLVNSDKHNVV